MPESSATLPSKVYPASLEQMAAWFCDEHACREYLERLRWPNGFVCPSCGSTEAWRTKDALWLCGKCRRKASVTAGTIFHHSRLPLTTWFAAIWLITAGQNGVSARALQHELGLGSYETAWSLLHRLRRAMVRPGRERLSGLIELDEAYIGARQRGVATNGKSVVVIAVEINSKGLGRARLRQLPLASRAQIFDFVTTSIEQGATVRTDSWDIYNALPGVGYLHETVAVNQAIEQSDRTLPGVHHVASLVNRWVAGTLHSGISYEHLSYYLDEFTFRFNRRNSKKGVLFHRLLDQAIHEEPSPCRELLGGAFDPNNPW